MKHQQVVVDYWTMVKSSFTYLLLAFSGYILLKLVQTIFWLPKHLNKNKQMLEELATKYSMNMEEIEAEFDKELAAFNADSPKQTNEIELLEKPTNNVDIEDNKKTI